jgi:phosphate-selective porin OprO/OprP
MTGFRESRQKGAESIVKFGAPFIAALACVALGVAPTAAQAGWDYGKRGLEWSDGQTGSYVWLGLRGQARYTSTEQSLRVPSEYRNPTSSDTSINRGRYKIGAAYRKDLTFYHEYDLVNTRLLDLRTTWVEHPEFKVRAGQWKAEYNRERIDSSGKQQFVERSISTYWFTLDRQWGSMASGRIGEGSSHDSSWWAGVLAGDGLNTDGDGGRPMVVGRWQWNYTRNLLPFSQSALKRYAEPHASLAFAAVTNDSRYTRFSSDGGGQLPGYTEGEDNQYRVWQAMQEWAWQQGGLSFQQELHFKSIDDRVDGGSRNFYGGYAQVGWFPADRWRTFPDAIEVALRGAYVNSDSAENMENREVTFGVNWFINGHRNKFSTDVSYIQAKDDSDSGSDYRFQLQWELSI